MKAIIQTGYGSPKAVLALREVEKPAPEDDEVLIEVRASSVTFGDLAAVKGEPLIARLSLGIREPKIRTPGKDVAGVVSSVGSSVNEFKEGDQVFGDLSEGSWAAYAEFVAAPQDAVVHMPSNVSFEQAAGVPESGVVALQGLQGKGRIQSGQRVLICGASGGIGTLAVQIAKSFNTEVTGVCSTKNLSLVKGLGADHVIDYTREDFAEDGMTYDLILATAGYRSIFAYRRALAPNGRYVATGGEMAQIFQPMLLGALVSSEGRGFFSLSMKPDKDDLTFLRDLIEAGRVSPVIDKVFPLGELAQALEYYGTGHSRGKVIVSMER